MDNNYLPDIMEEKLHQLNRLLKIDRNQIHVNEVPEKIYTLTYLVAFINNKYMYICRLFTLDCNFCIGNPSK